MSLELEKPVKQQELTKTIVRAKKLRKKNLLRKIPSERESITVVPHLSGKKGRPFFTHLKRLPVCKKIK